MAIKQVRIGVDKARLEASFPKCPGSAMGLVDHANVAAAEVLQHCRNGAGLRGCDQQVHMIGHQYVCMQQAAAPNGDVHQRLKKKTSVDISKEAKATIVSPLYDVQRDPREF
jgi:hypothetical protein